MRTRRTARTLLTLTTAVLLLAPTAGLAAAQGSSDRSGGSAHSTGKGSGHHHPGRPDPRPTSYLLDPADQAAEDVFPEGVAVHRDTFYVGSTTDGTIYRGSLDEPVATPFLLGGEDGRTSAIGMKADGRTLFVAGGATGLVFAYDVRTRELVGSWQVAQTGEPTFLNDIAISPRGDVYVTDSMRPALYRIDARDRRTDGVAELPVFVDFTGTVLEYQPGFNVNGIVVSQDGKHLVVAQSNTAELFRVTIADRSVAQVDLGGEAVSGDGLVLQGRTLYAVERQGDVGYIVKIDLSRGLAAGTVVSRTTDPSFNDPTTAALAGRSLLVVNSQFGERAAGVEPGPFTVSRVPAP
ncbi:SMP-30/gluconolactonase/LRE family protein [Cellulomonas timonensis]|uniref:SMP-30/gluconolactonase/LRE family protein n=1 Tax=Cellulomonas timonensis TaxID=1689271 RepID=UPI000AF7C75F|nr:SMP-30/gluconolactonase/LRE family protein [Cellulomonas timonensis]